VTASDTTAPAAAVVSAHDITRRYGEGDAVVDALRGVSVDIPAGQFTAVMGPSGSGKSTLIRALAGLVAIEKAAGNDAQDRAGSIMLFGRPIQRDGRIVRGAKELRVRVGVIFQQFNLVPRLSVLTNVCLGCLGRMPFLRGTLSNFTMDEKRRAMYALTRVGMAEHTLQRTAAQQVARDHAGLHADEDGFHRPDVCRSDRTYTRSWLAASRFACHFASRSFQPPQSMPKCSSRSARYQASLPFGTDTRGVARA